jgi:hypothetical protein
MRLQPQALRPPAFIYAAATRLLLDRCLTAA